MNRHAVVLRASASAGVLLLSTALFCLWTYVRGIAKKNKGSSAAQGFTDLIGDTPLIEIKCLSEMTGCRILVCCDRSGCMIGWWLQRRLDPAFFKFYALHRGNASF